jgi:hypothetical protein
MVKARESTSQVSEHRTLLHRGNLLPRFDGTTVQGRRLEHEQLWQHRNVVLFVLTANLHDAARAYLGALDMRLSELKPDDTSLVISDHAVDGVPLDGVVIADRWGEIVYIQGLSPNLAVWPSIDDLLDWVEFVRVKCPECAP